MSIADAKKSRGRPNVDSEAVNVRLERPMLTALDAWRQKRLTTPSRPEAIRRLLEAGLCKSAASSGRSAPHDAGAFQARSFLYR